MKFIIVAVIFLPILALAEEPQPTQSPTPVVALTPTPTPPPQAEKAAVPIPERKTRFAVFLNYDMSSNAQFNSVVASNGTKSAGGSASYGMDNAPGAGLEISKFESRDWGWALGLDYEAPRNLNTFTITLNGQSTSSVATGSHDTISLSTVYANAIFNANDRIYIPFGLNVLIPKYTSTASSEGNGVTNITGSVGAQAGIGFHLSEMLSGELMYKIIQMKMTLTDTSVSSDFGTGQLAGFDIHLKLEF